MSIPMIGKVMKPLASDALISEPHLVLHVTSGSANTLVMIPMEPRRSKERVYFVGYLYFPLDEAIHQLESDNPKLTILDFKPRPIATLTDRELQLRYRRKGQRIAIPLRKRSRRYGLIKSLVEDPDAILLFDRGILREKIAQRAKERAPTADDIPRLEEAIYRSLNQYWAGGSDRKALTPYSDRSGAKGKPRKFKKKPGAKNRPTKAGIEGVEGLIRSERDDRIIRFCWRNYVTTHTTVASALRRMWTDFYSVIVVGTDGKARSEWLPIPQRPTRTQFEQIGPQQDQNLEAWRIHLPRKGYEHLYRPLLGKATDNIFAVGQRGAMDSTPADVELVSCDSLLARIGLSHRILVRDSLYGYIPGFYSGLERPSGHTALLAFLHAMSPKKEWLEDLDLADEIPLEAWIEIAFRQVHADNTDLRTEAVKAALKRINVGLSFVPTYRSDLNAVAETGHHIIHRLGDHHLCGSNYGRRTQRGEQRAEFRARHTLRSLERETARAVYTHNTIELDIELPLPMQDAGVRKTRLDMTRWVMDQGKVAVHLLDMSTLRAEILPDIRGTFHKDGVRLLRPDTGDKRVFVPRLLYKSTHPAILARMAAAGSPYRKHHPNAFDAIFKYHPYAARHAWFRDPHTLELIELDLSTDDPSLVHRATYYDVIDMKDRAGPERYFQEDRQQHALGKLEEGQERANRLAEEDYQSALAAHGKEPTKSEIRANKSSNRAREQENHCLDGMPIRAPESSSTPSEPLDTDPAPPNVEQQRMEGVSTANESHPTSAPKADDSMYRKALAHRRHRETP